MQAAFIDWLDVSNSWYLLIRLACKHLESNSCSPCFRRNYVLMQLSATWFSSSLFLHIWIYHAIKGRILEEYAFLIQQIAMQMWLAKFAKQIFFSSQTIPLVLTWQWSHNLLLQEHCPWQPFLPLLSSISVRRCVKGTKVGHFCCHEAIQEHQEFTHIWYH